MKDSSQTIKLRDGRRLGYALYGDPNGYPVFYFHGWPSSRLAGQELESAAKELKVRVIATDRPGIGLSDFQNGRTLLDFPTDISQLAKYLKINRFSLIGMSGGAPYVVACAAHFSNRVDSATIVVGLAPVTVPGILKGMAFNGRIGWSLYHRLPISRWLAGVIVYLQCKVLPKLGTFFLFTTSTDRSIYRSMVKNSDPRRVKEPFLQGIRGVVDELRVYVQEWAIQYSQVCCKTYLWYGRKDRSVTLMMGEFYRSKLKDSELIIKDNWGHLSRYEHEKEILLKALESVSSS